MESVFQKLVEKTSKGAWFRCDLKKKNLWINRKQYVKEGELNGKDMMFINKDDLTKIESLKEYELGEITTENAWEILEQLYVIYYRSVSQAKVKDSVYFKAIEGNKLSDYELCFNIKRHEAKAFLEGFILLASLQGLLVWQNEKHWFWQSAFNKDLVVLKDWITK